MSAKTGPVVSNDSGSAAVLDPNLAAGCRSGLPGISADCVMFLDAGYMMATLSNYGGGVEPVSQKIQNLVGRKS